MDNASPENHAAMLEEASNSVDTSSATFVDRESASGSPLSRQHTTEDALRLLRTLKDPLRRMLDDSVDNGDTKLRVPLERLDVMRSRPNQSLEKAHVMWAGPDLDSRAGKRLNSVCGRRSIVHALHRYSQHALRFGAFNFQRCRDAARPPAVEGRTSLRSISGSRLHTMLQRFTVRWLIPGTEKRAAQVHGKTGGT